MGVAIPIGNAALDEAGFWTKARSLVKSYLLSKPAKYADWFYAVTRRDGPYLSSIQDHWKGNTTDQSGAENYVKMLKRMNGVDKKMCLDYIDVNAKSAPTA